MNHNALETSSIVTSETFDTWETSSSTSTAWGPGALSGRAIKSLGEASLRGLEKIAIRWRFAKIKSDLPSPGSRDRHHGDTTHVPQIPNEKLEKIMDDLLELSRLDYYDSKVRHKALRFIMMQIGSRETGQLTGCITKWPREEIMIFLSEMMPCMPLLWHDSSSSNSDSNRGDGDETNFNLKERLELLAVYRSSQSPRETHDAIPFIVFISQLAETKADARRAVVDAGFLRFLATVHKHCSIPVRVDLEGTLNRGKDRDKGSGSDMHMNNDSGAASVDRDVVEAARDALSVFLDTDSGDRSTDIDVVLRECKALQMELVWPRSGEAVELLPLSTLSCKLAQLTPMRRGVFWRDLWQTTSASAATARRTYQPGSPAIMSPRLSSSDPAKLVVDRLCEIAVVLSIKTYHRPKCSKDLFDICFDLLVFCGMNTEDRDIADLSLLYLLQCVALGGEPAIALRDVLVLSSYNVNLDFFYRIIYPLL
ncbi:hypothetical protein K435DRAFT_370688 [Dendrothele bispora CBS 962.96]|uniref:Uncharacterized protein n=1 Tax=Dendrothele bispora (strain CBS 962.96) TaxID=1314807 RepID=A0A4S8LCD6_DENBC|nr:hypothetical protein K435DRAFT_370688 [Dendrothele bispora CBS 962.96]